MRAAKRGTNDEDRPRKVRRNAHEIYQADKITWKAKTTVLTTTRRITRQMTTDAVRRAVFSTAELLENILLHLPPKSVIGAQRTCRQFRDLVEKSVKLQEHVFLRHVSREWPRVIVRRDSIYATRVVRKCYDGFIPNSAERVAVARPVVLHPLISPFDLYINLGRSSDPMLYQRIHLKLPRKLDTPGSWRTMYLTNPPVTKAKITLSFDIFDVAKAMSSRTVEVRNGLTVGKLVDFAANQRCRDADHIHVRRDQKVISRALATEPGLERLRDAIESLEKTYRRQAQGIISTVAFLDVIAPTNSEWELIKAGV